MNQPVAARIAALDSAMRPFSAFQEDAQVAETLSSPDVSNFAFGNPQEMPLPGFVDALRRATEPQDKDWFAYKFSEPEAQHVVAMALREELGLPFEDDDIAMTTGAFGALVAALQATVDPGDEVIMNLPPWFIYEAMIVNAGGVPVKVAVDRETFDLDLDAIEAAITPRTRAIIINTPNNPTGRIYPPETLQRLSELLTGASARNGRRIYLISDEPYRRVRFDGVPFHSPLAYYPHSLMAYSYGKILLTPGQRLGYLALSPTMPDREVMRNAVWMAQVASGFLFPNAILQHGIADFEALSIDLGHLKSKRDRMVSALRDIGYDVHVPEGTFYLLPRSPWEDDRAFIRLLLDQNIVCLPGSAVEFPGFFRISLTASDEMIERSIAGFSAAFAHAQEHPAPAVTGATASQPAG